MNPSERALASFTGEDEELVATWDADTVNRGLSLSVPGFGENRTIGLTDRRLLWLAEDLEEVDLTDVMDIEADAISKSSAPLSIRVGAIALTLGLIGPPVLWLLTSLSVFEVLAPLGIGILVFGLGIAIARLRGQTVETGHTQHLARIKTSETVVQVFADEETVADLVETIDATRDGED